MGRGLQGPSVPADELEEAAGIPIASSHLSTMFSGARNMNHREENHKISGDQVPGRSKSGGVSAREKAPVLGHRLHTQALQFSPLHVHDPPLTHIPSTAWSDRDLAEDQELRRCLAGFKPNRSKRL